VDFRFLWFGQIVSLLGDWFNLIASATLVAELTGSGLAVGSLFVVRMLAPFLVSPVAGVVADLFNRKSVLIITDVLRGVTVLGFLLVRDPTHVWLLYSLTAVQLGLSGFFFPARNAILPDIVSKAELGAANTLGAATWSVMLAFGAAVGGLVAGLFGIYPAFIIDAFTFWLSALLLSKVKLRARPEVSSSLKSLSGGFRQYVDGLRYLAHNKDVFFVSLQKAALGLFLGATFDIVKVAIAKQVFVIGIAGGVGLGLMFALTGVGTGLGPFVVRRFIGDRDSLLRLSIAGGYCFGALGLALCALLMSFAVTLLGTFLQGLGGGIIWVFSTQLLLHLVPGEVRGRVFGTELAMFTLVSAAGAALVGSLLDTPLGISGVTWGMAALTLVPGLLWLTWIRKRQAEQPFSAAE
jgi:MFS family permease